MKERIKQLRKTLGLNQTQFGEAIGVKQGTISSYESGTRQPLDTVITSICREFDVNEEWLRNGTGKMFCTDELEQAIEDCFSDVMLKDEAYKKRLVKALAKLSVDEWEVLLKIMRELVDQQEQEGGENGEIKKSNI